MRLVASLPTLAALSLSSLALLAVYSPESFVALHARASENGLLFALSLTSAAAAAQLPLAIPTFGSHASLELPLFAAVALPYLARFGLRRLGGRLRVARAPAAPARRLPYSLPSRVHAALEAAARARMAAEMAAKASHCPRVQAPL